MTPTIANTIIFAKGSQYLATVDILRGGLYSGGVDYNLPRKLYLVRKNVEWLNTLDSSDTTLLSTAKFLYGLCGKYALDAQEIVINAGTIVTPITPITPSSSVTMPFYIVKKSDFTNATDYINPVLDGKDIAVFGNWINRYLESDEYTLLSGGIVRILISGFDSTLFDPTKIIIRIDVNGEAIATETIETFPYDLTGVFTIPNLPTGSSYQRRQIVITPNGFTYAWDSLFEFTDNYPEQPDANGVGTKQIYTFMYDPVTGKNVCVGQSLNAVS